MTAARSITVLVADDHSVVRQSVCTLLNNDGGFTIVGEAGNGREAVKMARRLSPDVILMDISMPVLNGLEATRQIIAAVPSARVIILSAYSDDEYIERAYAVGAAGMLAKQTAAITLAQAVREVATGCGFFRPVAAKPPPPDQGKPRVHHDVLKTHAAHLTSRESQVLQLLAGGVAHKQVAVKLSISLKAVEQHLQRLMDKLKVRETADLARFAIIPALIEGSVRLTLT